VVEKLKASVADFWRHRYLLFNLVSRDFKLKYRRSVLGVVWSVLNPLLMCLVYWAVFSSLMDMRGSGIDNFPVFLMCGQLLFNFFNEATSTCMNSVLGAAPLLKKVYIPKYIFPLEKCCFAMVNCVFSFVALLLVMIFTGSPFQWTVFEALYPLITLFFFSLGVGLVLAAGTVFFRDIMHIWSVFTTALLYFSAIFYDPTQMTFTVCGFSMQQIIRLNPMYWYITGFRRAVMWGQGLTTSMVLVCGGCAAASMAVGLWVFHKTQDRFVLHI
jgi:ABC-type polysaccharide/polyol phosphate export permease